MTAGLVIAWACGGLAAFFGALTLFNLVVWPRARATRSGLDVSVLIPMRDERDNAAPCVRAALACEPAATRVIVCDDGSTDGTSEILAGLKEDSHRVHVREGQPMPSGWAGKVHACWQLSQVAESEWLLYVDADTRLDPSAIGGLADLVERYDADIVTAVPRQEMGTFIERMVMPMLHTIYSSFLPTPLVWASRDPRFLAANGQFMAIRRDALERIGGWAAIKDAVVDDMEITRRAKEHGLRVVFADGTSLSSCRMYRSGRELWEGFSKNIAPGLGGSAAAVGAVSAVFIAAFVVPFALLPAALLSAPDLIAPAILGVAANLVSRTALAARFGHAWWSALLHPAAALYVVAMAFNSLRWLRRGGIRWKGRVYAS